MLVGAMTLSNNIRHERSQWEPTQRLAPGNSSLVSHWTPARFLCIRRGAPIRYRLRIEPVPARMVAQSGR
jgi:hypothetical protein